MIAVDTNVLIYACDQADPRRQSIALDLITNAQDGALRVKAPFAGAHRCAALTRPARSPRDSNYRSDGDWCATVLCS